MTYSDVNIDAEKTANAIFCSIGSPMPSIVELIRWTEENFGIRIKIGYSEAESFMKVSGLTYYDPSSREYQIWIKASDYTLRQNFTLCHEIGHIIRNSGIVFGFFDGDMYTEDKEERFCNRFAAAFLMPKDIFTQNWKSLTNIDVTLKKARMTAIFKVSGEALFYRLKELNITTET